MVLNELELNRFLGQEFTHLQTFKNKRHYHELPPPFSGKEMHEHMHED